jgi:hypothetical protein
VHQPSVLLHKIILRSGQSTSVRRHMYTPLDRPLQQVDLVDPQTFLSLTNTSFAAQKVNNSKLYVGVRVLISVLVDG